MKLIPKYLSGSKAMQLKSDEKPIRISKKAKIRLAKDYIESVETGILMEVEKRNKFINSVGNHFQLGLCWVE